MPDVASALLQSYRDKAFGLTIAEENTINRPTSRTAFCELKTFDVGSEPLTATHDDEQIIIMQVSLNYPANTGDTAAKAKAQEIYDSYTFNNQITGTGYQANVSKKKQFVGEAKTGWYRIIVRITFLVYSDR